MKPIPNNVRIFGQQNERAKNQINADAYRLSMQIYSQVAIAHVNSRDVHQEIDTERLHAAARQSLQAARCYFEGLKPPTEEESK